MVGLFCWLVMAGVVSFFQIYDVSFVFPTSLSRDLKCHKKYLHAFKSTIHFTLQHLIFHDIEKMHSVL